MTSSGPTGSTGAAGASILGSYDNYDDFIEAHPSGVKGDAYLVGGELYVWNEESGSWDSMGSIVGPTGPTGPAGSPAEPGQSLFSVSSQTDSEDVLFGGNLDIESDSLDITVEPGPSIRIEQPSSAGTIIPFASGGSLALTTLTGTGLHDGIVMIGFGGGVSAEARTFPIILSSTSQYALLMPVDGTITAMYALFSKTLGGLAGQNIVIKAQLFQSTQTDNIFYPIDETEITLGTVVSTAADGTVYHNGVSDLDIQIDAGTRLLLVFYSETDYTSTLTSVSGYMSGSLRIE